MTNNPKGINFESDVLQYINKLMLSGQSRSKVVNEQLRVAMSCNGIDEELIRKFIQLFSDISNRLTKKIRNDFYASLTAEEKERIKHVAK